MNVLVAIATVGGLWSILMSMMLNTNNFKSTVIFKFIPFVIGLGQLYVAGKLAGLLP